MHLPRTLPFEGLRPNPRPSRVNQPLSLEDLLHPTLPHLSAPSLPNGPATLLFAIVIFKAQVLTKFIKYLKQIIYLILPSEVKNIMSSTN